MAEYTDPGSHFLDFNQDQANGEPEYPFDLVAEESMTTALPSFPEWKPKEQPEEKSTLHFQALYNEEPDSRPDPQTWPTQPDLPRCVNRGYVSTQEASNQINGDSGGYEIEAAALQDVVYRSYDSFTYQQKYEHPVFGVGMRYQVAEGPGEGLAGQHLAVDGKDAAEASYIQNHHQNHQNHANQAIPWTPAGLTTEPVRFQQHHASQAMPWTGASLTDTASLRKEIERLQAENSRLSQTVSEHDVIQKPRDRYREERDTHERSYRMDKSERDEALKDADTQTEGVIVGSKEFLFQACTNLKREVVILRDDNRIYMHHNKILLAELRDVKQKTGDWEEFWQRHFAGQEGSQELLALCNTGKDGGQS